jgi:hypothetical protein
VLEFTILLEGTVAKGAVTASVSYFPAINVKSKFPARRDGLLCPSPFDETIKGAFLRSGTYNGDGGIWVKIPHAGT